MKIALKNKFNALVFCVPTLLGPAFHFEAVGHSDLLFRKYSFGLYRQLLVYLGFTRRLAVEASFKPLVSESFQRKLCKYAADAKTLKPL